MDNIKQHDQLWGSIINTLNTLSYIATGAISLSLTFLGYILNTTPSVRYILRAPIFSSFQSIYLLYFSWFLFLITIICVVVALLKIRRYLFNSQTALLYEKFKEGVREEDKKNVDTVISSAKSSAAKYRIVSSWTRNFILAILTLISFVIVMSNRLILT